MSKLRLIIEQDSLPDITDERCVVIYTKSVDDAHSVGKALLKFTKMASVGGDCDMYIVMGGDEPVMVGGVGHDVGIVDVWVGGKKIKEKDIK